MITFTYGTPYLTTCYGGVETVNCDNDATWTEEGEDYGGNYLIALICDRCKEERETYIKNLPAPKSLEGGHGKSNPVKR